MEPFESKIEAGEKNFDVFRDEYWAKMILANKIIDDKLLVSNELPYVRLRQYNEAGESDKAFNERKFIYFREMRELDESNGLWKINWEEQVMLYYKYLPYHDEVNIMLDGKHIVIPKKTYDVEKLNKTLSEKGLDELQLSCATASPSAEAAGTR